MPYFKTEAIILSQRNFGEADRILTIFSRQYGKLITIAKGVRRSKSRKGGSLNLFNEVKLVLARGRNWDIITEVEVENSFSDWRQNLVQVGVVCYLAELTNRLTAEGQKSQAVFRLLTETLGSLHLKKPLGTIRSFEEQILDALGFGVPAKIRARAGSLADYIETILESRLKSKQVLKKIKYELTS